ncbi:MAG TPA: hypothetical protein VFY84_08140 [Jiangellales bacterium]|nr:hypothetical protein [Jiangellales bacterium]
MQPVVDLCQAGTCADPRAPVRVDGDGIEAAQVEDPAGRIRGWKAILNTLAMNYGDRLTNN